MAGVSLAAVQDHSSLSQLQRPPAPTAGLAAPSYVGVALTQAAVAGCATYAIGKVTQTYLAQGASWGEKGPKAAIAQVLDSLDEASIMNRIKAELRTKLGKPA